MVVTPKVFAGSLLVLPILSGCDAVGGRPNQFGVSYDDCILKNIATGMSDLAASYKVKACIRVWEQDASAPAKVEASLYNDPANPHLKFTIANDTKDIVTEVQIAVSFYNSEKDAFDAELQGNQGKAESKLTWTLPVFLDPGEQASLNGSLENRHVPSGGIAIIPQETKFSKMLRVLKASRNG